MRTQKDGLASLESSEPSFTNPSFRSPPHSNKLPHFRAGHTQNDQSPFCGGNPCSHHLPTETRPRRRAPRPAPRGRTKEAPYFTTADSSGRSAPKSSQLSIAQLLAVAASRPFFDGRGFGVFSVGRRSPTPYNPHTSHGTAICRSIGVVPGGSMGRHIWQSHGVPG